MLGAGSAIPSPRQEENASNWQSAKPDEDERRLSVRVRDGLGLAGGISVRAPVESSQI